MKSNSIVVTGSSTSISQGDRSNLVPATVVVLTHNEERNLPRCLTSLRPFFDDVHVLDSGSSDGTCDVARRAGVAVHSRSFDGFGTQRNWAIENIPHRYPWALHLDADEECTPELAEELRRRLASQPTEAGFYLPNKLMLGDRWLRYAGGYPTYQVRLFHTERLRFANHGHGQREVTEGELGYFDEPYLHHAFSKGLDEWFAKHARYAREEAELWAQQKTNLLGEMTGLLQSDRVLRRRAAKQLSFRCPGRPMLRMLYLLLLKRGLLDGRAGWTYARMMAAYEAMTAAHLQRIRAGIDT